MLELRPPKKCTYGWTGSLKKENVSPGYESVSPWDRNRTIRPFSFPWESFPFLCLRSGGLSNLSFFPTTSESETFLRKKQSVLTSVLSLGYTFVGQGIIYSIDNRIVLSFFCKLFCHSTLEYLIDVGYGIPVLGGHLPSN